MPVKRKSRLEKRNLNLSRLAKRPAKQNRGLAKIKRPYN